MNGKKQPVFVILPYKEYQQLLDDAEDEWLARMTEEAIAEGGEGIPLEEYIEKRFGRKQQTAASNHRGGSGRQGPRRAPK